MAKRADEKLKILYLLKILSEETDLDHRLTTEQLIKKLADYGISAERKSIYRDLDCLTDFNYDIERGPKGACLASRDFELPELKLLVDAVQASKFISAKKSSELIKKISSLLSRFEASELNRGVFVSERVKSEDKGLLYTVDGLHKAMNSNRIVTFKYWEWTPDKKKKEKHGGKVYRLSPWGLIWDDEYYYLIAYDSEFGGIKHFRVDKIKDLKETEDLRQGYEIYSKLDLGAYSKKVFGMFNGRDDTVVLEVADSLAGVIFDRFGTELTVFSAREGFFSVAVQVKISRAFLSWVVQFGNGMKIISPAYVVDEMKAMLDEVKSCYGDEK